MDIRNGLGNIKAIKLQPKHIPNDLNNLVCSATSYLNKHIWDTEIALESLQTCNIFRGNNAFLPFKEFRNVTLKIQNEIKSWDYRVGSLRSRRWVLSKQNFESIYRKACVFSWRQELKNRFVLNRSTDRKSPAITAYFSLISKGSIQYDLDKRSHLHCNNIKLNSMQLNW